MTFFQFFHHTNLNKVLQQAKEAKNAVIVDVRTEAEYQSGHIPDSINIPLQKLNQISITKDKPLFIYCQSGGRSMQACAFLKKKGYQAVNMGGIIQYRGELIT